MIPDPEARGRALSDFYRTVEPRLFADLEQAGVLAAGSDAGALATARREWQCFALYACVRGLVAAGGFNRETARAIDAMHESVLERWKAEEGSAETLEARRARISERYAEYGVIGQEGGASGAPTVTRRLGEAAARHLAGGAEASRELAEVVGGLHEALVEGSAEAVRRGG